MAIKGDIQNREDIRKLVAAFYRRLLKDGEFEHIFFNVAQIDILNHLDIMVDFWDSVLFQAGKYENDLVQIHLDLNQKFRYGLNERHFGTWLEFFNASIDELFEGEKAKEAKARALSLATIIKMKMDHLENMRMKFNN